MEKDSLINVALLILIVGLVVVFGSQLLISYQDSRYDESILANSNNLNLTYTIPVTLTSEEGITSSSATRLNQTWLDFDGVNDNLILPIDNVISISFWYKNETTDWQHLVNASGTIYLNGSVETNYYLYPIYNNGSDVFIGKEDAITFTNISIDDFRTYSINLSSNQITEIFNGGRT